MSSDLEATFDFHLKAVGFLVPEREYRFAPPRRWRFDFAWPSLKLAVELEGGIFSGGRHTRGTGFQADCAKYNAAVKAGWRVLRFTAHMVNSGEAVNDVIALGGPHE